jgi:hypothetical protein
MRTFPRAPFAREGWMGVPAGSRNGVSITPIGSIFSSSYMRWVSCAACVKLIFYTMMEEVIHFHGVAVLKTA